MPTLQNSFLTHAIHLRGHMLPTEQKICNVITIFSQSKWRLTDVCPKSDNTGSLTGNLTRNYITLNYYYIKNVEYKSLNYAWRANTAVVPTRGLRGRSGWPDNYKEWTFFLLCGYSNPLLQSQSRSKCCCKGCCKNRDRQSRRCPEVKE